MYGTYIDARQPALAASFNGRHARSRIVLRAILTATSQPGLRSKPALAGAGGHLGLGTRIGREA